MKIFIGYDPHEITAYHVLCHSILRHASGPVSFTPLVQSALRTSGYYTRRKDVAASTEFSLTRFLVPALSQYHGYSLFLDCDMLMRGDVYELMTYVHADPGKAVYVCQHDYTPRTETKFLGQRNDPYPRKNWSSVMLFNNVYCPMLTPKYVNLATPAELHRFDWLTNRDIGELPLGWNYLVGEPNQTEAPPKNIHYTQGGPWFRDYAQTPYAQEWFDELDLVFPSLNVPKPVGV
jgi:hypothetical protein